MQINRTIIVNDEIQSFKKQIIELTTKVQELRRDVANLDKSEEKDKQLKHLDKMISDLSNSLYLC